MNQTGVAIDGFAPARAQKSALAHVRAQSSCVLYYRVCFDFTAVTVAIPGGPVSPILVRPVREQFEHDRIIRVLQARYKRKFEVAINPGVGAECVGGRRRPAMYPDLVLVQPGRGRKLQGRSKSRPPNRSTRSKRWPNGGRSAACARRSISTSRPTTIDTVRRLCAEHRSSPPRSGPITRPSIRCDSRWCIARRTRRRSPNPGSSPISRASGAGEGRDPKPKPTPRKPAAAKPRTEG